MLNCIGILQNDSVDMVIVDVTIPHQRHLLPVALESWTWDDAFMCPAGALKVQILYRLRGCFEKYI